MNLADDISRCQQQERRWLDGQVRTWRLEDAKRFATAILGRPPRRKARERRPERPRAAQTTSRDDSDPHIGSAPPVAVDTTAALEV